MQAFHLPKYKKMIITVRDDDKEEIVDIARRFKAIGYEIYATKGTGAALRAKGVDTLYISKLEQDSPNLLEFDFLAIQIDLVIDTPNTGRRAQP